MQSKRRLKFHFVQSIIKKIKVHHPHANKTKTAIGKLKIHVHDSHKMHNYINDKEQSVPVCINHEKK